MLVFHLKSCKHLKLAWLFHVLYRAVFTVLGVEPLTCLQLIIWNKRENNKCIAITTPRPLTFIATRIRCHMYNAVLTRLADQFTIVGGQIILILSQNKTRTLMVNKIHTLATCKKNQCTPRPRTTLLMCLEKYIAIGISAIGNHGAL